MYGNLVTNKHIKKIDVHFMILKNIMMMINVVVLLSTDLVIIFV